ncbi:hypothetical protein DPMN_125134 [Dreissena polymorpha]|uniref:Uncharacterized protein n=1 Tax=Dreissena polymorpha TaxID=45954 RepID=A0A9D4GTE4_DREPO|nr:hypothetical protein DPMN_125134 [Dreissena polymorpha]
MIRRKFLTQPHYCLVPPRLKPVNSPADPGQHGLATVYPGEAPAEPRLSPVVPRLKPAASRHSPGFRR